MKFGKVGQAGLVSAIALVVATLFTACGNLNVGFLFLTANKFSPGQVLVYEVNSESGAVRPIPTSPFPSGGRNPVAEAVSPDSKNLYVVNEDDNNITQFGIGTDGKVYPQSTVNTPGAFPLAVTLDAAGKFLYTIDTLSPVAGCSPANPCPGDIAVFPVNADGSLGSAISNTAKYPDYWPLLVNPSDTRTALTPTALVLSGDGGYVYVSAVNKSTGKGYLFGFATSGSGSLTPLNGGLPYAVGPSPAAILSDAAGTNLFVADSKLNAIQSFSLSAGVPALASSVAAGDVPSAMTLDGTGFLYATNSADGTVTGYKVSGSTLTVVSTKATGINPVAVIVDPRHVGYLYTVSFLGSTISGFQIQSDGTLLNTQNSPYATNAQPNAIVGIAHNGTVQKK